MDNLEFLNPGAGYRGTDLWMLNDKLDDHELERQMEEMKKVGCGAFIARTFIGLVSDYPGEDYLGKMGVIINKAKEIGQKVFLQAGYMPGGVVGLPEEYTHTAVKMVKAGEYKKEDGKVIMEHKGIKYCVAPLTEYLDLLNPDAMKYYMKTAYTDIWGQFKDEFGKTIVSVWVDEPHFNPPHLPWTANLPEEFENTWGYRIEDNIPLLFNQEGDYSRIRYHYWRTVLSMLKSAYFTEVSSWCRENNLKFSGHLMGEDTLTMQIGFTCSAMPLYKYMDIPGIDFLTGNTGWSRGDAKGIDGYKFVLTPLQCVGAAHQAGKSDVLCEMYGVSTQGLTFRDQRYLLDYFAALGITHRCVHGLFYSLRGRRKRAYVPHFSYYQPWWNEYGTVNDYCGRVSWFMRQGEPKADVLVLHPVESAFMEYGNQDMSRHPFKKSMEEMRNADSKIDRMNLQFIVLLNDLLGMQCSFELGDEDTLAEWGEVAEDGRLKIGHMIYRAVVLPSLKVIRESTLQILQKFAAKGGKIISIDSLPDMIEGDFDKRLHEVGGIQIVDGNDGLKHTLLNDVPCDYAFECDDDSNSVWINVRDWTEGQSIFIFNTDRDRGRKGVLKIKGRFIAEEWRGEDGSIKSMTSRQADGCTLADIKLEAGGSRMLLLKKAEDAKGAISAPDRGAANGRAATCRTTTQGKWNISRKNPNALLLEFCSYKKENGDYSLQYPILAIQQILTEEKYTGNITLKFAFEITNVPKDIRLVMEEPDEYSLKINGKTAAMNKTGDYYLEKSFEVIDISGTLKKGVNFIEATRYFEPLQEPSSALSELFQNLSGVELESLYLIGDFGVYAFTEPTNTGCIRFNKNFRIDSERAVVSKELTMEGYPFYAGTVVLEQDLFINEIPENEKAVLKVSGFRGCAGKVYINGIFVGRLCWEPYEVDATGMLVKGKNKIAIELTNTLRNLLGPYHRPEGDLAHCWRVYPWTGEYDPVSDIHHPNWYKDRMPDTVTWTESYMQAPFGIDTVEITFI